MTESQQLRGRFVGRLARDTQPIELLVFEGDYDCIVQQAIRLVESTGELVRAEDPLTGAPILTVEIRPTVRHHYLIRDWDGDGWVHRYSPREAMA